MLVRYLRPAARRERQRLVLVLEQHRRLRRSLPCESAVRWAVQQRVVQSGVGERKVPRVGVVEAEPKVRQQHALRRGLITQTYGTLLDCENECEQDTVSLEACAPPASSPRPSRRCRSRPRQAGRSWRLSCRPRRSQSSCSVQYIYDIYIDTYIQILHRNVTYRLYGGGTRQAPR